MTWRLLPVTRFGDVRAQWQTLNARSGDTPVLHPDFIGPLLQEFASPADQLAILDSAAGPSAMTVLSRRNGLAWQSFQPANAPIGLWVCDPALPLPELLRDLLRSLPGPTGLIGLLQQDPDITPRPPDDNGLSTLDYIETARVSVSQPFDDYWAQRGKNLRRNMKRQHTQLEREGTPPRLEVLRDPADMPRAITDYARLEGIGWKRALGTDVQQDDPQSRFYVGMMQRFCAAGKGHVFRYFYGEDLAATDICIEHDGVFAILKTTYDEAIRKTSPAQLMRHEMFEALFRQGRLRRIEFYGRVMDWHRQWTDEIRTLYHVNQYRWPLLRSAHQMAARLTAPRQQALKRS